MRTGWAFEAAIGGLAQLPVLNLAEKTSATLRQGSLKKRLMASALQTR
jgi:hypothetical protein